MDRTLNNRYKLIKPLGAGSSGNVYLAEDIIQSHYTCAIKVINSNNNENSNIIKSEFEILTQLRHPNIVSVFDLDFDTERKAPFIIMEYVNGETLSNILSKEKLPVDTLLSIIVSLCRALAFIHSRDIIHRDITPHNIMINTEHNLTKLMDFGLSVFKDQKSTSVDGTLAYLAPEVLDNIKCSGSDIFSLGMIFYEMIAGQSFFNDIPTEQIPSFLRDKNKYNTLLSSNINTICSNPMWKIANKMISFCPTKRFTNTIEIITHINTELITQYPLETIDTKRSYVLGTRFVGRQAELELLKKHIENPSGLFQWVLGDAGVGKSRLFVEIKKHCRLANIIFLEGSCFERSTRQFGPFLSIVSELLPYASNTIIKKYGNILKTVMPTHSSLKTLPTDPNLVTNIEYSIYIKSLSDFIFAMCNEFTVPVVLYLNDMHWSDTGTIDLLNQIISMSKVIETKMPICLVSSRNENTELITDVIKNTFFQQQLLRPLNRSNIYEYIYSIFGSKNIGKNFINNFANLHNKASGNALYLQEIVKHLLEQSIIERNSSNWDLTIKNIDNVLPPYLHDLISKRITKLRLSPCQIKTLEILAMVKKYILYDDLLKLVDTSLETLTKLVDLELVSFRDRSKGRMYTIYHDIISRSIIDNITDKNLQYENLLNLAEQIYKNDLYTHYEDLAYYAQEAKNQTKAVFYLYESIQKNRKKNDTVKTLAFIEQFLDIIGTTPSEKKRTTDILIMKSILYFELGQLETAVKIGHLAVNEAKKLHDIPKTAEASLVLCRAIAQSFDKSDTLINIMEEQINILREVNHPKLLSQCYNRIGSYYLDVRKEIERSLAYFYKGLHLSQKNNDTFGIMLNTGNLSIAMYYQGDFNKAVEFNNRAYKCVTQLNSKSYEQLNLLYQARYHYCNKDFDNALSCISKQISLANELGIFNAIVFGNSRKAEICFAIHNYDEATNHIRIATPYIEAIDDREALFCYNFTKCKLSIINKNPQEGINELHAFLQSTTEEELRAKILYELWNLTGDEEYYIQLKNIYHGFMSTSSFYEYHERYEILERGIPQNLYYPEEIYKKLCRNRSRQNTLPPINENNLAATIRNNSAFSKLLLVIHRINRSTSFNDILSKTLSASVEFLHAERGAIILCTKKCSDLIVAVTRNVEKSIQDDDFTYSRSVVKDVLESKEPTFAADIIHDQKYSLQQSIINLKLRSVMCAPLENYNYNQDNDSCQLFGVVYLDSKTATETNGFAGENIDLLQILAAQASAAISKTVINEELDKSLSEKTKLTEILKVEITERKGTQEALAELNNSLEEKVKDQTKELRKEIQERKATEKAYLKAKEEAERANIAKGKFLATTSHEIRTPLSGIIGTIEMIKKSDSIEKCINLANTALHESGHLLRIINDTLDHEKIDSGKLTLEETSFDIHALIGSVITTYTAQAESKGLNISSKEHNLLSNFYSGDPLRIKQILFNLINNAIKFTPKGSVTLVVEGKGEQSNKQRICFSIIDTGIGIPTDKQKTIFEEFTQVDESISRKYGGTGLGTSISFRLVSLMGGTINLKSKEGHGSTFFFELELPFVKSLPTINEDEKDSTENNEKIISAQNILVAEDYPINQQIIKYHLESGSHNVDIVDTGVKVIDSCNIKAYDIIFMDMMMPEMNGDEATKIIRQKSIYNTHTPIIGLTANADENNINICLQSGMNAVINKPIKREELYDMIQSHGLEYRNTPFNLENSKEELGSIATVREVVEQFIITLENQIEKFDHTVTKSEPIFCDDEFYTMKHKAAHLTAIPLLHAMQNFENRLKKNGNESLSEEISALKEEFTLFKNYVHQTLFTRDSSH